MREEKRKVNRTVIFALSFAVVMFIGAYLIYSYFASINYETGFGYCLPIVMFILGATSLGALTREPRIKITYHCSKCGAEVSKDTIKCPRCNVWLTSRD